MRRVFCLVAAACALLLALASAPSVHAAVMGIDFGSEFIKVRSCDTHARRCRLTVDDSRRGIGHPPHDSPLLPSAPPARTETTLIRFVLPVCSLPCVPSVCQVASVKPGTPFHIVVDEQSKRKIPSVVAFDNGERHFGNGALQLALRKPKETYLWAHRLLGKDINSPQVAELRRQGFPWEIVELPGRNSLGFRHSTAKNADDTDVVFSVEEVVAMSLQHVMKIAETDAESPVKDCVITVPPYFTHRERAALLDAAEIAGLNVMSLLNENTAAAIQYGIDRKFVANETHTVLFYNMGSTSTKVDLAVYSAYVKKERGGRNNNKTIGQFEMRGMGYDDTLGGNAFEHRIAEWIIREVNQQLASKKITYDITTNMKAMAKIRSAAEKAKTVLSANQESLVFLNSLYEDTDFKMMLTREQFYEMTADLIERAANPIQQVIDDTGVTLDQIDAVVIIGGSVRIPAVQASIKAFVGKEHLTQSLNGDEAMVMGAVFRAANLSATFKVRPLGLVDTTPYAVGVRVTDQEVEVPAVAPIADGDAAPAEVDEESASSGSARASFSKRASLFKRHNRLERKKTVQIPYTADFKAQLAHEVTKSNALPTGISTPIDLYNITGLTQLMNNTRYADLLREQEPRVSLSFLLDQSGMTSLVRAEAALDEMVKVPVPKKKPAKVDPEVVKENDTDAAAAEEEKAPESDATQTEGAEGDNTDAEKADAAAEKAESEEVPVPSSDEESASTDAAESSDAASESESAAAAVEEEEPEFTLKKKTHTIQLKVTKVGSPGSVAAMTQVDKIAAKAASDTQRARQRGVVKASHHASFL